MWAMTWVSAPARSGPVRDQLGAQQQLAGVTALLRRRFELDHPEIAVLLLPRKVA
jgi:hypothetical protein